MSKNWFPKIEAPDDARKLAKQGAIGTLLFAAMNLGGILFAVYANKSPVDQRALGSQGVNDFVVGAFLVIPVLLVFAYRIYRGKGWLVAGVTLTWFIAEVAMKVAGGTANVGWMIFYAAVAAMLFNGLRGCWWLSRVNRAQEVAPQARP